MERKLPKDATAIILDDHKMFSASFAMLLERTGLFSAVHAFSTAGEVMEYFIHHQPCRPYVFLDYFIPECNVVYLMGDVRRFCPSALVVMISSLTNAALIRKLLSNNVNGFISKTDGANEILACLKSLAQNKVYYSSKIQDIIATSEHEKEILNLTSRELEVLRCMSWGKSVEQIALELNISSNTVVTHRRNLLVKSGCHSVAELVGYALRAGLITNE
jgi:two-component system, NarL family, response regulator FusR